MKITKSEFVTSVANANNMIKDERLQVAFVGRSNVGKSSLLNMLVNKNKLAKTSSTPGRTRLINYFLINDNFYFVDLPGYGYAKASKTQVKGWQGLLEPYLEHNEMLRCVCVLVDIRHKPTQLDTLMVDYLAHYNIPFLIIATKADKFSKSQIKNELHKIANTLGVGVGNIYATSSKNRYGKQELLDKIQSLIQV